MMEEAARVRPREQTGSAGRAGPRAAWWRDRAALVTGAVLLLIAAASWIVVVRQAAEMGAMDMGAAPSEPPPPLVSWASGLTFLGAWGVMMAAMMLPSAVPMLALYGTVSRNLARTGQRVAPSLLFAAVYLAVWLLVGVPVYLADALIRAGATRSPEIAAALPAALALVLVAAGVYQFTALKRVCLRHCQSPLSFLMAHWRSGYGGTLGLGLAHARYCVGCCWGLMAVLVAAGAMGLQWVLLIAAVVFAEKLLPRGEWTARVVGVVLVALGVAVFAAPGLASLLRSQPTPAM
jgi:predicted metal-binding membrane protein